jgi:single-strand DNA-binding protein|tara:strand:- start:283 stop:720 length:438 start_codon:yes stop_codon:yes gene_type:complete
MAKGINRVHLIGNVGQDIELRRTNNGMSVCNIRLAMTERVKSGDQWVDQTEWIDVVVFGHSAESCSKFLRKGSTCFVEGRLQTRSWEDQQGNKRSKTEVVAKNVQFLDKRESAPQQDAYNNNYESQQSSDNPYGGSYNTGGNPYA